MPESAARRKSPKAKRVESTPHTPSAGSPTASRGAPLAAGKGMRSARICFQDAPRDGSPRRPAWRSPRAAVITLDLAMACTRARGGALARHASAQKGIARSAGGRRRSARARARRAPRRRGSVDELPGRRAPCARRADVRCSCLLARAPRGPHTGRTTGARLPPRPRPDLTGYGAPYGRAMAAGAPGPRALPLAPAPDGARAPARTVTPLDPSTAGTITGTVTFAGRRPP